VTLLKSIGDTHEVNVHNAQDNVVRLVADLSSAIGDEVALPQMAQAELEKSNVFTSGTATDARSRRVVPLKFHCSRLLSMSDIHLCCERFQQPKLAARRRSLP
jgi:hypothetical protein